MTCPRSFYCHSSAYLSELHSGRRWRGVPSLLQHFPQGSATPRRSGEGAERIPLLLCLSFFSSILHFMPPLFPSWMLASSRDIGLPFLCGAEDWLPLHGWYVTLFWDGVLLVMGWSFTPLWWAGLHWRDTCSGKENIVGQKKRTGEEILGYRGKDNSDFSMGLPSLSLDFAESRSIHF